MPISAETMVSCVAKIDSARTKNYHTQAITMYQNHIATCTSVPDTFVIQWRHFSQERRETSCTTTSQRSTTTTLRTRLLRQDSSCLRRQYTTPTLQMHSTFPPRVPCSSECRSQWPARGASGNDLPTGEPLEEALSLLSQASS